MYIYHQTVTGDGHSLILNLKLHIISSTFKSYHHATEPDNTNEHLFTLFKHQILYLKHYSDRRVQYYKDRWLRPLAILSSTGELNLAIRLESIQTPTCRCNITLFGATFIHSQQSVFTVCMLLSRRVTNQMQNESLTPKRNQFLS